jgi:hypothetical protein
MRAGAPGEEELLFGIDLAIAAGRRGAPREVLIDALSPLSCSDAAGGVAEDSDTPT